MTSYVYPPVVPPGQAPPLAVVTETDKRAWIYIAAASGLSMTLLATAIRGFIRAGTRSAWGVDDVTLGISTILSVLQTSLIFGASSRGLGSSSLINPDGSLDEAKKLFYASNLIYVLSLGSSRVAMVLFLRRLTPVRIHVRILTALFGAEAAWTIAVFMAVVLQCNVHQPWALGRTCPNGWFLQWQAAESIGAVFELFIFCLAIWTLTWNIKMPIIKKTIIITSFALRLSIIILIIALRLSSFDKTGFVTDPTLHIAKFICWAQTEMNLSIIAATIPIAHKFLASLVTNYGGAGGRNMSASTYRTHETTMRMDSIESKTTEGMDLTQNSVDHNDMYMRQYEGYRYGIEGNEEGKEVKEDEITRAAEGDGDGASVDTQETRKMMIRKDVSYQVEFDT